MSTNTPLASEFYTYDNTCSNSAFQSSKMTLVTPKRKDFLKSHEANLQIRDRGKVGIFMPKGATLSNLAEHALSQCFQNEQVSLLGFEKYFSFWVASIILKDWETEQEMGVVIMSQAFDVSSILIWNTSDLLFVHKVRKRYTRC